MIHSFDTKVAEKVGINGATILNNLYFWIEKNRANEKNFYDGYYWTYNSTKAFKELFPYLSQRQIETALKKLKDDGFIITGNYNAIKYDRTLWYAITKKGESILQNREMEKTSMLNGDHKAVKSISQKCEMDFTSMSNGFYNDVKPIPYSKPDIKTSDNIYNENSEKLFTETSTPIEEKLKDNNNKIKTTEEIKSIVKKITTQPNSKIPSESNEQQKITKKPTIDEVNKYFVDKGYNIDVEKFYNCYNKNNWMQDGKLINWEERAYYWHKGRYAPVNKKTYNPSNNKPTNNYTDNKPTNKFKSFKELEAEYKEAQEKKMEKQMLIRAGAPENFEGTYDDWFFNQLDTFNY